MPRRPRALAAPPRRVDDTPLATLPRTRGPRRALVPFHTADMVDALNDRGRLDGTRYETVFGELLVTPAATPWHSVLVTRLVDALRSYARGEPAAGWVAGTESMFRFERTDTYVMPDVWAVRLDEMRHLDWLKLTVPLWCAEVVSPSSRRGDRFTKRHLYQLRGVPLYWVVDGDARLVEVWRPGDEAPHLETRRLAWHPDGAATPFAFDLAELFAPV